MAKKIEIKHSAKKEERTTSSTATFAFGKDNYMIILVGVIVLVIGYLLMVGGGSDDPKNFNPEIFSTRRITVAPITLLLGFGIVLYGIMKKPKED
ncbi:hypothetical protein BH09BAC5_BH09BAC5_08250 [soil metagenome]